MGGPTPIKPEIVQEVDTTGQFLETVVVGPDTSACKPALPMVLQPQVDTSYTLWDHATNPQASRLSQASFGALAGLTSPVTVPATALGAACSTPEGKGNNGLDDTGAADDTGAVDCSECEDDEIPYSVTYEVDGAGAGGDGLQNADSDERFDSLLDAINWFKEAYPDGEKPVLILNLQDEQILADEALQLAGDIPEVQIQGNGGTLIGSIIVDAGVSLTLSDVLVDALSEDTGITVADGTASFTNVEVVAGLTGISATGEFDIESSNLKVSINNSDDTAETVGISADGEGTWAVLDSIDIENAKTGVSLANGAHLGDSASTVSVDDSTVAFKIDAADLLLQTLIATDFEVGVYVTNAGTLTLEGVADATGGSSFEDGKKVGILAGNGASIKIADATFTGIQGVDDESAKGAIYSGEIAADGTIENTTDPANKATLVKVNGMTLNQSFVQTGAFVYADEISLTGLVFDGEDSEDMLLFFETGALLLDGDGSTVKVNNLVIADADMGEEAIISASENVVIAQATFTGVSGASTVLNSSSGTVYNFTAYNSPLTEGIVNGGAEAKACTVGGDFGDDAGDCDIASTLVFGADGIEHKIDADLSDGDIDRGHIGHESRQAYSGTEVDDVADLEHESTR